MIIKVSLNGTAENPYLKFGLTQNPFPQIPRAEYASHLLTLQSLGGPPIPLNGHEDYIRAVLAGWSREFVDLVVSKFEPGKYVKFEVSFPE